jgi:hypothetical protein
LNFFFHIFILLNTFFKTRRHNGYIDLFLGRPNKLLFFFAEGENTIPSCNEGSMARPVTLLESYRERFQLKDAYD